MRIGTILRNAAASGMIASLAGSRLQAYTGERPTSLDGSISDRTLVAEYTMGSPAFGNPTAGVLTANAITGGVGLVDEDIGWVRWLAANGTDVLADLSAGVGAGEVQFDTLRASVGVASPITAFTFAVPAGS